MCKAISAFFNTGCFNQQQLSDPANILRLRALQPDGGKKHQRFGSSPLENVIFSPGAVMHKTEVEICLACDSNQKRLTEQINSPVRQNLVGHISPSVSGA